MKPRWILGLAVALALAHAASYLGSGPFDDDFICYRYARNLVEGHGLVFQPGERFEGFTNPLWVLLLAGGLALALDPERLSLALSILSVGAAAWAVGDLWLRRSPGSRWPLPALFVAACPAIAWHGVAGLGTTMLAALLALGWRSFEEARVAGRAPWGAALFLALAALLRQEAVLFALPFAVLAARRRGGAWGLVPLAAVLGWTLFRFAYYGRWLPVTYAVKKLPLAADLGYGLRYLLLSTLECGVALALGLALFAPRVAPRERRATTEGAVAALLAYALFVVYAGGDFVASARFFVPLLPLAYLFACEGACALVHHPLRRAALGALGLALLQWTQVGALVPSGSTEVGVGRPYRFLDHRWNEERWRTMGEELGERLPPDTKVALSPIGVFGWTSRLVVVDLLGLTNDAALGMEPMLETVGMKGHHRTNPEWVLDRAPELVIPGNGHRDPRNGRASVNPWEAPLFLHPRFQQGYEHWVVPLPDGVPLDVWVRRGAAPPPGASRAR